MRKLLLLLLRQNNKLLVGKALHRKRNTLVLKRFLNLHRKRIGALRSLKILAALQHRCKLQSHQPAFRKYCTILLHVGLKAILQILRSNNERLAEQSATLCSANIKYIRQFRKILQSKIIFLRSKSISHARAIHEKIHPIFCAHIMDLLNFLLRIKCTFFCRERQIYHLRFGQILRLVLIVIRLGASGDLLRGNLAICIRKFQNLVSGVLDGRRLVTIDMSGICSDHALHRR